MYLRLAPVLVIVGCADDGIGAREQSSVALSLQAIEVGALAGELLAPARLDLAEDATTCPAMSRIEGYVTVDYDACVPQRGWVRGAVNGGLRLDLTASDVSTEVTDLKVGTVGVDGDLSGGLAAGDNVEGSIDLDGSDIPQARLDLTALMDGTLTLSGDVTLSVGEAIVVTLDAVTVAPGSGCFAPTGGGAMLEQGLVDVAISFSDDGTADITTSRDESGTIDLCGLDAGLFGE
jgi:hypothetical protein